MKQLEKIVEGIIVNSRWLMAPFYVGLILALVILLFRFVAELFEYLSHLGSLTESAAILGALTLIDISLTGNLVLIVIFSGYENFVSKINAEGHPDWPDWMTKVDFSGLKQKLLASIVAISAIQVLKAFMNLDKFPDSTRLGWLVGIHVVFVFSVLVLSIADRIGGESGKNNGH